MFLRSLITVIVVLAAQSARAQRDTTRDALMRTEELLQMRMEDGVFDAREVVPVIVVSVQPMYEESRTWFPVEALKTLVQVFGKDALRMCEACLNPRTYVQEGFMEQQVGAVSVSDITRLDENARGTAVPAKAAVWLDETEGGVALRVIDLRTSRIIVAENVDPTLEENTRSRHVFNLAREADRRARGDTITQLFADFVFYPGQHVSFDFTEQWGETNHNLSGFSLSFFDPVLGVGGSYYRATEVLNALVGAKILLSVPTAVVQGVTGENAEVIDRLLTAVFVVRVPFGSSNYGATVTASTNGRFGIGISFLNTSFLPFLP